MPQELQEWLPREDILNYEETLRLIRIAVGLGVSKVRVTGGNPSPVAAFSICCARCPEFPAFAMLAFLRTERCSDVKWSQV